MKSSAFQQSLTSEIWLYNKQAHRRREAAFKYEVLVAANARSTDAPHMRSRASICVNGLTRALSTLSIIIS